MAKKSNNKFFGKKLETAQQQSNIPSIEITKKIYGI